MNRLAIALVFVAATFAPALFAQATEEKAAAQRPSCPSTATLDQLIKAIDAAVSGPGNQDRTCFRALFLPDARLMPLVTNKDDGSVAPRILTVQDWIDLVAKRGSTAFYERQVKVTTETFGHEAHLWSTYETRATPDGKAEVRGINSIQAVFDGKTWMVISIVWQAETPTETVPAKYLP
jgi:hypothetical protein